MEGGDSLLKDHAKLRLILVGVLVAGVLIISAGICLAASRYGDVNLSLNSRGEAVRNLQQDLTALGINTYGVDGIFGAKTLDAVLYFQKTHGLDADGIVGPQTKDTLSKYMGLEGQSGTGDNSIYVVQPNDNLWAIAQKYRTTVAAIKQANNLSADLLQIGQKLVIPNGSSSGSSSTTTTPAPVQTPAPTPDPTPTPAPTTPPQVSSFSTFWKDRQSTWLNPVKGQYTMNPTTGGRSFGSARTSSSGTGRSHAGIDFIADVGTLVFAMTDGQVIRCSDNFYAGTGAVEVRNNDGSVARYCEIRPSNSILQGQTEVNRGDVIGTVIANNAGGSHMLHLEMYLGKDKNGSPVSGSLTQSGNYTYWYVAYSQGPFQRRADLIDPSGAVGLPSK